MLGLTILPLAVAACDVAAVILDPGVPIFEQSWDLAATSKSIAVADLLPSGSVVSILPDSSGFSMSVDSTTFTAQLGTACSACSAFNGTNAPKPAFTLLLGNSTPLPTDIVSAAILAGSIQVKMVNNLTFDPLYVNTGGGSPPQGFLVIVIRSGSVVLGRDSIHGAAVASGVDLPFSPGTTVTRNITLTTGTVTNNLSVDVTLDSPAGDHLVPIDVSKSFVATATVPSITVASVQMNVPSRTINSGRTDLPLSDVPLSDHMVAAKLNLTITNPFTGVGGNLDARFIRYDANGRDTVMKTLVLASGTTNRTIALDSTDIQVLLSEKPVKSDSIIVTIDGSVSSATPITVTPKQKITLDARILAVIRTPTLKDK